MQKFAAKVQEKTKAMLRDEYSSDFAKVGTPVDLGSFKSAVIEDTASMLAMLELFKLVATKPLADGVELPESVQLNSLQDISSALPLINQCKTKKPDAVFRFVTSVGTEHAIHAALASFGPSFDTLVQTHIKQKRSLLTSCKVDKHIASVAVSFINAAEVSPASDVKGFLDSVFSVSSHSKAALSAVVVMPDSDFDAFQTKAGDISILRDVIGADASHGFNELKFGSGSVFSVQLACLLEHSVSQISHSYR